MPHVQSCTVLRQAMANYSFDGRFGCASVHCQEKNETTRGLGRAARSRRRRSDPDSHRVRDRQRGDLHTMTATTYSTAAPADGQLHRNDRLAGRLLGRQRRAGAGAVLDRRHRRHDRHAGLPDLDRCPCSWASSSPSPMPRSPACSRTNRAAPRSMAPTAWLRYSKFIAPLSVWCNWFAWSPVLSLGCSIAAAYILNALAPIPLFAEHRRRSSPISRLMPARRRRTPSPRSPLPQRRPSATGRFTATRSAR